MLRWITAVGVLSGVGAAMAEPVRMTEADIKHVMQPGAVLEIDTPLRIAIPVKVVPNGMVTGEAGALGLTLGAMKDRGRWWTEGDQLCVKWFRWFDAKARCIVLHREGSKVQWHESSGESGTATITEAPATIQVAASQHQARRAAAQKVAAARQQVSDVSATPPMPPPRSFAIAAAQAAEARMPPARMPESDDSPAVAKPAPVSPVAASEPPAKPREPASAPRQHIAKASPPPAKASPPPSKPRLAAVARKPARAPADAPDATSTMSSVALVSFRVAGVVDGDMLNVRSGPSEYHPTVGAIPARGRGVQIIGQCRQLWCPIRHGRLQGWVNRYYLAEDGVEQRSARR